LTRSKLEMYLDILKVLSSSSQLKQTYIAYETNINAGMIKKYLDLLMKQNLIEKRNIGRHRRVVYSITQRGITVLEHFRQLKQALPIVDENCNFTTASI
jgi:predicted transcriptional regulator